MIPINNPEIPTTIPIISGIPSWCPDAGASFVLVAPFDPLVGVGVAGVSKEVLVSKGVVRVESVVEAGVVVGMEVSWLLEAREVVEGKASVEDGMVVVDVT